MVDRLADGDLAGVIGSLFIDSLAQRVGGKFIVLAGCGVCVIPMLCLLYYATAPTFVLLYAALLGACQAASNQLNGDDGSRIRQRDAKTACNGQPGRSYSKDDLDRTGQPSLAEALRTLDPSIR